MPSASTITAILARHGRLDPAEAGRHAPLTVWLLRLGIKISHSRPYHPQTNGEDEQFHRRSVSRD